MLVLNLHLQLEMKILLCQRQYAYLNALISQDKFLPVEKTRKIRKNLFLLQMFYNMVANFCIDDTCMHAYSILCV